MRTNPSRMGTLNSMFFIPTPKSVSNSNRNKAPIGIMKVKTIQNTAVGDHWSYYTIVVVMVR